MNTQNFIILSGNLTDDPKYATHKDGSKTVFLTLAVRDNFKSKVKQADGTAKADYATQFLNVQGFVSATPKNPKYPNGVYDLLEKGMSISVNGHIASYVVKDGAVNKYGKPCNRWEQCVRINNVQLLETKAQTIARHNRQAKAAQINNTAASVASVKPVTITKDRVSTGLDHNPGL